MKNKSFVRLVNKKRGRNSDDTKLDLLQKQLSEFHPLRDEVIINHSFIHERRYPDLVIKKYGHIIPIELDGSVHGSGDEMSMSSQTYNRNSDYLNTGLHPVIINEEWCQSQNILFEVYAKCVLSNISQLLVTQRRNK